jgi:hypothetical protein
LVLHADPEGRIRVLFPLDPTADDFIRGGRDYEIRDRDNGDAIVTAESEGFGTVYVAYSQDPFRYGDFSRGDHWDYRAFEDFEILGEAEVVLTQIAQRMAIGTAFVYDADSYYLNPPAAYTRAYDSYWTSGRHDHHDVGVSIGFHLGYVGWPLHPYRYRGYYGWGGYYGYYGYYDPWYYDPWYFGFGFGYAGWGFGFGYGYGYGYGYPGYYYCCGGPSYYYSPGYYYATPVAYVNPQYTQRNRTVVGTSYRDRRLSPTGTSAGARRTSGVSRPEPRRASTVVARNTPTRATGAAAARRTTGAGTATPTQGVRRTTPQRSTTAGSVQRATPTPRRTTGTAKATPQRSTSGQATARRTVEYRLAPRVSSRGTQATKAQPTQRPPAQRPAGDPRPEQHIPDTSSASYDQHPVIVARAVHSSAEHADPVVGEPAASVAE